MMPLLDQHWHQEEIVFRIKQTWRYVKKMLF